MSYTFLREQGEESSAECFADIPACARWRLTTTAERCCSNGSGTESSRNSQSGMMSEPLTESLGAAALTSCAEGFHARESVLQEWGQDLSIQRRDCGGNKSESLATYDRVSCSWKTRQCLLFAAGCESLETLPKWGMTAGGELFPLRMPFGLMEHRAWITNALECGFTVRLPTLTSFDSVSGRVPTPTVQDAKNNAAPSQAERNALNVTVGGPLNPDWVEWLMGWPIGWTDLRPLAMGRFQQWLSSHGKY